MVDARAFCAVVSCAATSSVDARTDRVLQDMIKTQFSNSTVIAIAHRLNTIMNSDRVIVMEDGRRKVR